MSPPQTCAICQKPLAEREATRQEVVFEDGGFRSHLVHERCPSAAVELAPTVVHGVVEEDWLGATCITALCGAEARLVDGEWSPDDFDFVEPLRRPDGADRVTCEVCRERLGADVPGKG